MPASSRVGGLLAALLLLPGAASAQDDEQSYEFLNRQAGLQGEYGQLGEAVLSMQAACATPEGGASPDCWRRLASIAERDGRIGLAVDAWAHGAALGDPRAAGEGSRLEAAYGRVRISTPPGRSLPSLPFVLEFTGLVIDPTVKAYLARLQEEISRQGLDRAELWLPAGDYAAHGLRWTIAPGQEGGLELPASMVPFRHRAFGLGDPLPAGVAGRFELGGDLRLSFGGSPAGQLGLDPVAVGGQLRLGVHLGPVRVEARARAEGWPIKSRAAPGSERDSTGLVLLGQVDVGVDLMLAPRAYLTPHLGIVGGSLGAVLVDCIAERAAEPSVLLGECRLGAVGLGGAAGVDAWFLPPSPGGRLGLRIGLSAEAGAGGVQADSGAALQGDDGLTIVRMERAGFAWLRGGLDVGVSLRF